MKIRIPVIRPVCRAPIKPKQAHKIVNRYQRKAKHPNKSDMM